jgi:hypothetical protein
MIPAGAIDLVTPLVMAARRELLFRNIRADHQPVRFNAFEITRPFAVKK